VCAVSKERGSFLGTILTRSTSQTSMISTCRPPSNAGCRLKFRRVRELLLATSARGTADSIAKQ
jgi:hypothetical protein